MLESAPGRAWSARHLTPRRLPLAESLRPGTPVGTCHERSRANEHDRRRGSRRGRRGASSSRVRASAARGACGCGAGASARSASRSASCACCCVLFGLGMLAIVSALFGMFMAVASDLPPLEEPAHQPSVILDARGEPDRHADRQRAPDLPVRERDRAGDEARDHRDRGPPLLHQQRRRPARHRARRGRRTSRPATAVQGASTIPQQFVKISLAAENERTVFQKLREAALAYHLTRKWSKERILRNYLNSIYFGNGAYGIESAARTYFSYNHDGCGGAARASRACASVLLPHEAALLAAMVASPSAYDPVQHPVASKRRRDLVLLRMFEQGYLTRALYESEQGRAAADARRPDLPEGGHGVPVLHLLDQAAGRRPARRRPAGRPAARSRAACEVKTTIDSRLQNAAEKAIDAWLPQRRRARAPRWSRSPTRTAWCARWSAATTTASRRSTSPPRASASPAPRSSRSCSPRRCAGHQPAVDLGVEEAARTSSRAASASPSTTTRTPTRACTTLANATTFSDNAVYAQVGKQVETEEGRPARAPHGHPDAGLDQPARWRSAACARA